MANPVSSLREANNYVEIEGFLEENNLEKKVLDEGTEVEVENNKEPSETEALQAQLNEANEKFLRTLAEYDNYRKRSIKEKEQAYGDSKAAVLTELLPVLDNFERAASNKEASLEDYQKGIDMIFNQFNDILKKAGVEAFGEKGDEFDPNIHSAVMHIDDENEKENDNKNNRRYKNRIT